MVIVWFFIIIYCIYLELHLPAVFHVHLIADQGNDYIGICVLIELLYPLLGLLVGLVVRDIVDHDGSFGALVVHLPQRTETLLAWYGKRMWFEAFWERLERRILKVIYEELFEIIYGDLFRVILLYRLCPISRI